MSVCVISTSREPYKRPYRKPASMGQNCRIHYVKKTVPTEERITEACREYILMSEKRHTKICLIYITAYITSVSTGLFKTHSMLYFLSLIHTVCFRTVLLLNTDDRASVVTQQCFYFYYWNIPVMSVFFIYYCFWSKTIFFFHKELSIRQFALVIK